MRRLAQALAGLIIALSACAGGRPPGVAPCDLEIVVLGTAQDGGAPQLANPTDPAWADPSLRRLAASLALIDRRRGARFLFEATPDIREQLQALDRLAPSAEPAPGLDGVFLTHAHIGHYAGLMFLGHESIGARGVPVHAMPRMVQFLQANGPWDQLVRYGNIEFRPLAAGVAQRIGDDLTVTPYLVPHRDEYSETVGYLIRGPRRAALFVPDIDSWDLWQTRHGVSIERMIGGVDVAWIDATFFDDAELPGRDMSGIPHPRIADMLARFAALPASERAKISFIHLNHTNPARFEDSPARRRVTEAGFRVARRGERFCLR